MERGLVSVCTVTRLEVGYSARGADHFREVFSSIPLADLTLEYMSPAVENRALVVQGLMAERGQHRAPSVADLLIAATAELNGLTLLHMDKDFDLIADVTGQPVERLRV